MDTPLTDRNEGWTPPARRAGRADRLLWAEPDRVGRLFWAGPVRLLAFPALAVLFLWVVQLQGQSADYLEAKERYERKEFLLAMLAAQKAVQQDGDNADYRHLYGMTLLQLNQYTDAEPQLRKALALDPAKADFHYGVAALILQQRSETEDTTDPMGMGARNTTSKPVEESIRLLEKALELEPDHLKARMHLGRTYHQQNMRSKALRQFEAVAARDPRYAWAHYHLAAIHLAAGKFQEALQALQREVEDHPDHGQARLELGDLLLQLGKPKLALSQLTAVSEESQTVSLPDLHFGLAKVYRRLGQLDKAIAAARQSIQLLPDNPVAHRLLARLYQDTGQSESAVRALESYRELKDRIERFSRQ